MPLKKLCAAFAVLFYAFCAYAADFAFEPKINLLGFSSSPTDTHSNKYGQAQLTLPLSVYLGANFSTHAEYFFAYSYFDKEKDSYDKLNKANVSFALNNFEIKAGRDFLDLGLNSVIYFGPYNDRDLRVPSYFDGAFTKYAPFSFLELTALGGTFDDNDFYGATLKLAILKGFYFKSKENLNDLSVYGFALNYENDTFEINLLAAFNKGEQTKKHLDLSLTKEYNGRLLSGNIAFKEKNNFFDTKLSFGAEYLAPSKENSIGYMPINGYFDRGFIFGNINEGLETLTYKLAFNIVPEFLQDLNAEIKIYNFSATDKTLPFRDITNEIDFKLAYQYKDFSINFIYGYLKTLDCFNIFVNGFEDTKSINKFGLILSYQFKII